MTEEDAEKAAELESRCFPSPYTEAEYKKAVREKEYICLSAYMGDAFVGYAMTRTVLDEGELLDIATEPLARRRGVASALIRKTLELLLYRSIKTVMLEARSGNTAARTLYESFGFKPVGLRKNYYQSPVEDAVLYTLVLGKDG